MRRTLIITLLAFLTLPAFGQSIKLDFPGLADRADEIVDVTLDAQMIRLAAKFLGNDGDEREVRQMLSGLTGIYVRSFSFDKKGSTTGPWSTGSGAGWVRTGNRS
jgi:hypothetical protein